MRPTVEICASEIELAECAADFVMNCARSAIRERGNFMIALSGGSTPETTYRLLARAPEETVDWANAYIFFSDERFVPLDDPRSNYAMVMQTLFEAGDVPLNRVFPVPTDLESAAKAASAYEATLRRVFKKGSHEVPPSFDLILLGLGEDGHTASLFPVSPALGVMDEWVVATAPGSLPPLVERVTFTFPLLNAAREILFLVSGLSKAGVLRSVLEHHCSSLLPAAGIVPVNGNVTWLIDESAASLLVDPSN